MRDDTSSAPSGKSHVVEIRRGVALYDMRKGCQVPIYAYLPIGETALQTTVSVAAKRLLAHLMRWANREGVVRGRSQRRMARELKLSTESWSTVGRHLNALEAHSLIRRIRHSDHERSDDIEVLRTSGDIVHVPAALVDCLSPGPLLLMGYLAWRAGTKGWSRQTSAALAEALGSSPRTVRRHLRELQRLDLIRTQRSPGGATTVWPLDAEWVRLSLIGGRAIDSTPPSIDSTPSSIESTLPAIESTGAGHREHTDRVPSDSLTDSPSDSRVDPLHTQRDASSIPSSGGSAPRPPKCEAPGAKKKKEGEGTEVEEKEEEERMTRDPDEDRRRISEGRARDLGSSVDRMREVWVAAWMEAGRGDAPRWTARESRIVRENLADLGEERLAVVLRYIASRWTSQINRRWPRTAGRDPNVGVVAAISGVIAAAEGGLDPLPPTKAEMLQAGEWDPKTEEEEPVYGFGPLADDVDAPAPRKPESTPRPEYEPYCIAPHPESDRGGCPGCRPRNWLPSRWADMVAGGFAPPPPTSRPDDCPPATWDRLIEMGFITRVCSAPR